MVDSIIDENGKIEVGSKKYTVIKTGRAQAEQVVQFTRWLSMYGPSLLKDLQDVDEDALAAGGGMAMITSILGNLSSDALIDLFTVLVGCSKKDSEKYFDVGILVDVALEVYENQPGIRRLIDRFFSTDESEEVSEDSSTTLEEPTDIQTTKS
jgi:hypothetical protein